MKKWIFLLMLISATVFADDLISKVIPVQYIQATELQQALKPLLKGNEQLSVMNNNLIINASPETLNKIIPIIHQLDVPPVVFNVSIHQGDDQWLNNNAQDQTTYSTSSNSTQQDNQSVQVSSGQSAYVTTGANVPVVQQVGIGWFSTGVAYQRMQTEKGFVIQPQLQGQQVKLSIKRPYSQQNTVNQQTINQGMMETTTVVPLDQWVKISQLFGAENQDTDNSDTYQAGGSYEYKGAVYIKIQIANQASAGKTS